MINSIALVDIDESVLEEAAQNDFFLSLIIPSPETEYIGATCFICYSHSFDL